MDWENNSGLINNLCILGYTHGMPYSGKEFQHCPWCGQKLLGGISIETKEAILDAVFTPLDDGNF